MSNTIKALEIPDEIWLHIFDAIGSYEGLKRASRINRHFRDLIKVSSLDKYLFRTSFSDDKLSRNITVKVHPVLNIINGVTMTYEGALSSIKSGHYYDNVTEDEIKSILQYPVFSEFATYPAVTTIHFHLAQGGHVSNPQGVTVRNVVDKVIQLWSKKPSLSMRRQLVAGLWAEKVEDANYIDALCERTHFEGWRVVGHSPSVTFEAYIVG